MKNCPLAVEVYTLQALLLNPPVLAVFPQLGRLASVSFSVPMVLVGIAFNSTINTQDTNAVVVALNEADSISVSEAVGIIISHVGKPSAVGTPVNQNTFMDFKSYGLIIPAGRKLSIYASWAVFGDTIYASASLQVKAAIL